MKSLFFKICLQKNIAFIFVWSLKYSELLLQSLPPVQNCGNNILLLSKYNILEPDIVLSTIICQKYWKNYTS